MDSQRFDRIASSFAESHNRRDAVRLLGLAALGASGLGFLSQSDGDARRRRKGRKKGVQHGSGAGGGTGGGSQNGTGGGTGTGSGSGGGGGTGPVKALRQMCTPGTDTCASGLQCGAPTNRHTCSSSVPEDDSNWCCVPPGGSCTECDCCGNYYCAYDDNNVPTCQPNPEG